MTCQFSRNVSQSRWLIDDERMGEGSVQVLFLNLVIRSLIYFSTKYIWFSCKINLVVVFCKQKCASLRERCRCLTEDFYSLKISYNSGTSAFSYYHFCLLIAGGHWECGVSALQG